jgi:pseudouridylate synthase
MQDPSAGPQQRPAGADGPPVVRLGEEVAAALTDGRGVVALESTIIAHGLPRPANLEVAREVEAIVRTEGATPATVAVLGGQPTVGLDDAQLDHVAGADMRKASRRDLPLAMSAGQDAATTVAATIRLAALAGIDVFATGGIGGVHRGDPWDESADLAALATTGLVVVCSGVKSILDVRATLERLETHSVAVAGYRTGVFPGFYLADSGHPVDWRLESPEEVAAALHAARALAGTRPDMARLTGPALVVANPIPVACQLDPDLHDRVLAAALDAARLRDISHAEVTPFILDRFHAETEGGSLRANTELIRDNARLAARIAVALAT